MTSRQHRQLHLKTKRQDARAGAAQSHCPRWLSAPGGHRPFGVRGNDPARHRRDVGTHRDFGRLRYIRAGATVTSGVAPPPPPAQVRRRERPSSWPLRQMPRRGPCRPAWVQESRGLRGRPQPHRKHHIKSGGTSCPPSAAVPPTPRSCNRRLCDLCEMRTIRLRRLETPGFSLSAGSASSPWRWPQSRHAWTLCPPRRRFMTVSHGGCVPWPDIAWPDRIMMQSW